MTLIAAVAENGVIGRDGGLPWHLPEDMKHFRTLTSGHACIMGRRTLDEVERTCSGPLPNRRCIVLTRAREYQRQGVEVAASLEDALALVKDEPDVFVIGGSQVYADAMECANRLQITIVHGSPVGDTTFPVIDSSEWELVEERHHPLDEQHAFAMTFRKYERR